MLENMIIMSLNKTAQAAEQNAAGGEVVPNEEAATQTAPPVQDQDISAQQSMDPVEALGQTLQSLTRNVNTLIDIYQGLSGGAAPEQGAQAQAAPEGSTAAQDQQAATANTTGQEGVNVQQGGKTASYLTWDNIFGA
jgi:hypothetical protein